MHNRVIGDGKHECGTIGLTMGEARAKEILNAHGQRYWKATAKIGALFGSAVEGGDLEGIGRTQEEAIERLHNATVEFHESLWV